MPVPAEATERRVALLVATADYGDPALVRLRSPGQDASDLAGVLRDPQIGGFEVTMVVNASSGQLQEEIEGFCADRGPGDHLMIYLSCHGVLDDHGRLYYAATNTRRLRLAATAVPATWLSERLEDCRARRQILVLDCCHSGAFARGAKGVIGDPGLALQQRFEPHGRGRVVLTASRSTEYSFEGGEPSGEGVQSVFTRAIIDGLRTGDADRDRDGRITVTDLYHYVYENVRSAEPRQTPELWTYGAEGDLLVAHSVRGAVTGPSLLPEELRVTLESPRARVRETAVAELAQLLDGAGPSLAMVARQALQQIADEDIARVAVVARAALGAVPGSAAGDVRRELAERARREEQARQEQARQEQARQEQARREEQARQEWARDGWAREEQARREQARREQAQQEQAQQEQAQQEQAGREERARREQAQQEQARREERARREQAQQEQARREEQARRQVGGRGRPADEYRRRPAHPDDGPGRPGPSLPRPVHRDGLPLFGPVVLAVPLFILALNWVRPNFKTYPPWWIMLVAAALGMLVAATEYRRSRLWVVALEWTFLWFVLGGLYKLVIVRSNHLHHWHWPLRTLDIGTVLVGVIIEVSLCVFVLNRMRRDGRPPPPPPRLLLPSFLACLAIGFGTASMGYLLHERSLFRVTAWVLLAALLVNLAAPVLRISRIGRPGARAGA